MIWIIFLALVLLGFLAFSFFGSRPLYYRGKTLLDLPDLLVMLRHSTS